MALTNREIADVFETIADMLLLKGEKLFTILAYRHAADAIRALPRDLRAVAAEGKLEDIPSVGKAIAAKIIELLETDKLNYYDRLAADIPPGVVEILRVNGIGPKKAMLFWKELGIDSVEALQEAAEAGKLNGLPGMGAKTQAKILEAIASLKRRETDLRTPLGDALPAAELILQQLMALPGVKQGVVAGSIRRGRPTIGDIDLLITAEDPAAAMSTFVHMDTVARILGSGETKSSVELHSGVQVDLRVLPPERWGTALQYFTGSQAHNIATRDFALRRGYTLNESAFTRLDNGEHTACATEEEVYAFLGLPFIPPELRENWGEIEAAREGRLPNLITEADIHADLHMHTLWSDGTATVQEMAEAALARGRRFIVITDHSRGATIANGLTVERLMAQVEEVRRVDALMNGRIRVFHGTEMEIRADGEMDFPDEVLEKLDFVVASLHVGLRQPREQVTERLVNALKNPHVDLIGHPRGQLINKRDPADLDMDVIFETARQTGTALEINANPERLDLEAGFAKRAVELGITLAIDTDAHSFADMDLLRYGVMTARRGWVEAKDVLNTWPLEKFQAWVGARGH